MTTQAFTMTDIIARHNEARTAYHEFLRVPSLSAGQYRLKAKATDPQQPHAQDELYHVLHGHSILQVEGRDIPVGPGSIVYVPAGAAHRFHTITEDLEVLVVFAPAESGGGGQC